MGGVMRQNRKVVQTGEDSVNFRGAAEQGHGKVEQGHRWASAKVEQGHRWSHRKKVGGVTLLPKQNAHR